jgi:hypothetical protein
MKTLPALSFLAALVAFVVLPLNFEISGSLLFSAGLAAILIADYTRPVRAPRLATCTAAVAASGRSERFGLAA